MRLRTVADVAWTVLLIIGLGAAIVMFALPSASGQATVQAPARQTVACTSASGTCGGYAGWHDVAHGHQFTRITGTLTVPRADCASSTYLTSGPFKDRDGVWSWIGLGGDPGKTVGQAGILELCIKGQRYPQIWEWTTVMTATSAPIRWFREPGVQAGDTVYVSVRTHGSGYLFNMRIPATGWSLSNGMPCPQASCINDTAEAVVEAIAHDNLPVFTGAHFAGIHVWAGWRSGVLADTPWWTIASNTIPKPGGGVLVRRGPLTAGTTFTPEEVTQ